MGFSFVDFHIVYEKKLTKKHKPNIIPKSISNVNIDCFEDIKKIIKSLYKHSRFLSIGISQEYVDRFYSEWAKKAILGTFDDFCLGFFERNKLAVTCKILTQIGLIGVGNEYQGKK
ncbi:hypothetical protein [Hippea alviniae]|uniref:hypothetical protein n=1 Tax=Hippea alviniae TaxID=1279027 RepID=UPI0003B53D5B|nr:hypothetical protein [Hippea alviniae]